MSTDFRRQLLGFQVTVTNRTRAVFDGCTAEVAHSIRDGSPLTGAPGQPVDTGFLKSSWIGEEITDTHWQFTTNVAYAPVIETGLRAAYDPEGATAPAAAPGRGGSKHIKSEVGGQGSVMHTRAGWPRIVDHVTKAVTR